MRKYLILAVLIVALMAVPAFASVQNIKVSGDIKESLVVRHNFDLGLNAVDEQDQNVFLSQVRIGIDADLTDNVSACISLLNERIWNDDTNTDGDIEVDLAYVELREMLYSPLTVTIGRQVLFLGNGLILGDGPDNTTAGPLLGVASDLSERSGQDGIKFALDYDPLTIEAFAFKMNENDAGIARTAEDDDADLYGITAAYRLSDKWNSTVQGYFLAQQDNIKTNAFAKLDTIYIPGFLIRTNPIKGLATSLEMAWQRGTDADVAGLGTGNQRREAMAIQVIADYVLPFEKLAKYNPIVGFKYTYVSGDSNPGDVNNPAGAQSSSEVTTAWNQMYEGQAKGKIYNALMNLTNAHIYEYSLVAVPVEDVTAKLTVTNLYLDKKFDQAVPTTTWRLNRVNTAAGSLVNVNTGKTHLGWEIDTDLVYDYTEDVAFKLSTGWFIPGDVFTGANDDIASQVLTSVDVAF